MDNCCHENFENEIDYLLLDALKNKYNICFDNEVYIYLYIKNAIILDSGLSFLGANLDWNESLINLIKDELKLKHFVFNNKPITNYGCINNYSYILENWEALYQKNIKFNFKDYTFDGAVNKIRTIVNENSKRFYKKYNNAVIELYFKLIELDKCFNISNKNEIEKIEGFLYNDFESLTTINEKLEHYFYKSFYGHSLGGLSEADIEHYFFRNLDKIEEGLIPISRQYSIKEGFIDILAKDKNDRYVIIELKIKNDKSLVWQVLYYPKALVQQLGNVPYRVLTLSPVYNDSVYDVLKDLNVEILKYKVQIIDNKITDSVVLKA